MTESGDNPVASRPGTPTEARHGHRWVRLRVFLDGAAREVEVEVRNDVADKLYPRKVSCWVWAGVIVLSLLLFEAILDSELCAALVAFMEALAEAE